jgi:hypothetical protein
MMDQVNPFAQFRASDYTDEQINSLWVEIGPTAINTIIEPRSKVSKFILGGKGTGKTHLLRYYSYSVARLRSPKESGMSILAKQKFLAIFLRATGVDAARFEATSVITNKWQQLFGVYLELRLVEGVLEALCDIKSTSNIDSFDDRAFIAELGKSILDRSVLECQSISDLRAWIIQQRRHIDDAVNNAAFTGSLELRVPFSIGSLCLPVSRAISKWNSLLSELPLIYLIDEIENFSASQQQVVNSFIRYGEGLATFRVTGRLYARKTFSTLADGEENREGSEFKTAILDDILRKYPKYPEFAKKFVVKRLGMAGLTLRWNNSTKSEFDPRQCFEEISSQDYYSDAIAALGFDKYEPSFIKTFVETYRANREKGNHSDDTGREISTILTKDIPLLLQKLNLLLFCKKHRRTTIGIALAERIRSDALTFLAENGKGRNYYATAYGHYALDLFAQLSRESKKAGSVPYAGFDTFVRMSSGNPRNLLIILGRAYEIAVFKDVDFIHGEKLSIAMQTESALEAAKFMYERDTNYGSQSEQGRDATTRLASLLRTARYAMKIPEVSPLAVSFSDSDLTPEAAKALDSALNYSFVFDISDGRPDRNSQRINRKIQLNPLLSPRWGLPVGRRGDLSLNRELVNSVFAPQSQGDFDLLLRVLNAKWNNPFKHTLFRDPQSALF